MPKLKPNKSVVSRCKITGTGKVRFNKAGRRHLNSGLTGDQLRSRRGTLVASKADIPKLQQQLGRRLKGVTK
ncbi:MAG: bL35 family ribosomal protein [Planctomycetota bacterium]